MTDERDVIRKFLATLPALSSWIDRVLERHRERAVPAWGARFAELAPHFSRDLLERTNVVVVADVPFPPLGALGLHELADAETMPRAGVTFRDTFFVQESHQTSSLYFHEMVHVVQWNRLGTDRFLLAYGLGLLQHGYEESPLESMAFDLQRRFERDDVPTDLIETIRHETEAVWDGVAPLVPPDGPA